MDFFSTPLLVTVILGAVGLAIPIIDALKKELVSLSLEYFLENQSLRSNLERVCLQMTCLALSLQ